MFDFNEYNHRDYSKYIRNMFPAFMSQKEDSNNQKWLQMVADIMIEFIDRIQISYDAQNFRHATGNDLRKIAKDWGVSPSESDEDFLKFEIALMMLKRHLGNDENSIIKLISNTLGADVNEFTVETRRDKNDGEPERLGIYNLPRKYLDNKKREEILYKMLIDILGDEVNLYTIEFNEKYNANIFVEAGLLATNSIDGISETQLSLERSYSAKYHIGVGMRYTSETYGASETQLMQEKNYSNKCRPAAGLITSSVVFGTMGG